MLVLVKLHTCDREREGINQIVIRHTHLAAKLNHYFYYMTRDLPRLLSAINIPGDRSQHNLSKKTTNLT